MEKKDIIIGIDPDINESGVAVFRTVERHLHLHKLQFPDMLKLISDIAREASDTGRSIHVYVEAGWLNASNWHTQKGKSANYNAHIGQSVGRNQAVGMLTIQMLERLSVPVSPIKPLPKSMRVGSGTVQMWSGRDGKITAEELEQLAEYNDIHIAQKRLNQDQRDAALIAMRGAGITIAPNKYFGLHLV